jgi:hypothetical protein
MRKNDRREARRVIALCLLVAAFLIAAAGTATAVDHHHHLAAHLYGSSRYSFARGHAHYEEWSGHREFDIDMWNMGRLRGDTLVVFANGQKLGTVRVRSDGGCHMHRDAGSGQFVPSLSSGDVVAVKTQGGALVASGTLRRRMMTMELG